MKNETAEQLQIRQRLNGIAERHTNFETFLREVAGESMELNEIIETLAIWFEIRQASIQYFRDIITRAESLKVPITWQRIDFEQYPTHKKYVAKQVEAKASEVGIEMTLLATVIKSVVNYIHEKKAQLQNREQIQPAEVPDIEQRIPPTTHTDVRSKGGSWSIYPRTTDGENTPEEKLAEAKRIEKETLRREERELISLGQQVDETNDVVILQELSKIVKAYEKKHPLRADEIKSKINTKLEKSRKSSLVANLDNGSTLRSKILKDLCKGILDVTDAKFKINKIAPAEPNNNSHGKCRIASARITPAAYISQMLMQIIIDLKTNAQQYPIVRGEELKCIQQLQQLGVSLQVATGAVVDNLIARQEYQITEEIIQQYRQENQSNPTTQRVVESWTQRMTQKQHEVTAANNEIEEQR